jgi:hypothetical protein
MLPAVEDVLGPLCKPQRGLLLRGPYSAIINVSLKFVFTSHWKLFLTPYRVWNMVSIEQYCKNCAEIQVCATFLFVAICL